MPVSFHLVFNPPRGTALLGRSLKNLRTDMTTSSEKPKKSLWGQEQWLPHAGLAAVGATAVAVFAVLAGWWGGLSRILTRELTPQLLLDTAGVLFLVILVLSYSLYRKIKVSKIAITPPPTSVQSPRIEPSRLNAHQERLLIEAANKGIDPGTLADIEKLHPEESKFHFNSIYRAKYLEGHQSHSRLSDTGRAYLLRHGLMPPAYTAPKRNIVRVTTSMVPIPGSGMPPAPARRNE